MSQVPFYYFVGIDQSKDFFDVVIKDKRKKTVFSGQFYVNRNGFIKFKKKLESLLSDSISESNFILGVESTGVYHKTLFHFFTKTPFLILELNPLQIKRYSNSQSLRKNTNDRISAAHIADFLILYHDNFAHYKKLSPDYRELRDLTRLIISIDKNINVYKNKIKSIIQQLFPEILSVVNVFTKTVISIVSAFPSAHDISSVDYNSFNRTFNKLLPRRGKKISVPANKIYSLAKKSIGVYNPQQAIVLSSLIKILSSLLQEKDNIQRLVKRFVNSHPNIKHQVDIISSLKGIGLQSAAAFLSEIGDISRFPNKNSLTAFAGLDPATQSSGVSINKKGGISRMGSSYLRKTMYIIAQNVANHNTYFGNWKRAKAVSQNSAKKALVSLANKLTKIFFALLSNNTPFDYSFINKSSNFKIA